MGSPEKRGEEWIVTGASSGIGRAAADLLAAGGARLVLSGRDTDRLAAAADAARVAGAAGVVEVAGDLRDPSVREDLVTAADGACDGLVNAAGFSTSADLCDLSSDDVCAQIDVNVRAVTHLTHALATGMAARGSGFVLNVASLAAWQGVPGQSVYAATKAYVLNFTVALHSELRSAGVRVTALCPGLVRTRFFENAGLDDRRRFTRVVEWDEPESVARAGLRGVRANRMIVIPGWRNRLSPRLQRLVPRSLVAAVTRRMMERTG